MSAAPGAGGARIHQQGYRRYDGPRLGPGHAIRALVLHTVRHVLGFRRRFRSKLIPVGAFALAVLPALGFSAALMIIPDFAAEMAREILPGPERYLGGTSFLVFVATAVAGPAALCGDRLHGSLALYLASPLTRRTYLLGKALAVVGLLAAMTILPSLVYVLGVALAGVQDQSVTSVLTDVVQVVLAGGVVAVGYGALSMAGASLTDRQGVASGLIVGASMISGIVLSILVEGVGLPRWLAVLDVNAAFGSFGFHLHGAGAEAAVTSPVVAFLGSAAWLALLVGFVVVRYERLQVTR